jgi:hypothetical protein
MVLTTVCPNAQICTFVSAYAILQVSQTKYNLIGHPMPTQTAGNVMSLDLNLPFVAYDL